MDTLTHALTGAVLSHLGFKDRVPAATFTLVTASVLPDIDWASRFFGIASYLRYHRTVTHSLLGILVLAITLAVVVRLFFRRSDPRMSFSLALFAGLFHLLMDLVNPYGTQLFYPFLSHRYAWNWITVVDPYITIPLVACLFLIRLSRLWRVKAASVTLGFLVLFICLKGLCHQIALKELSQFQTPQEQTLKGEVYPDIFSPFAWKGVVETERSFKIVTLNILKSEGSIVQNYVKPQGNRFTESAKRSTLVRTYLGFAHHPLMHYRELEGYHFVSWQDLAYGLRGRRGMVAEVILNDQGEILHERFSFVDPKLHPERIERLVEKIAEASKSPKRPGGELPPP